MSTTGLTQEALEERLQECRQTYKLNVGYAALTELPQGFVSLVRKYNPHITELELSSNNLTDLPDDLDGLPYLRTLRLKYNQLRRLPAVVTRLRQLSVLELAGNQISKLDAAVANMGSLKDLDLSGNMLAELPPALCTLPRLEVLHLENNRLEALPDNLGDLGVLTKLDISTNCLRFLPASMGRLRKIQRVDAANNMLVRVPPAMGHLKTLKEFNLRYNNLDERFKAKVEEGLSRLLAFLREEEERERLEEIERLKPIGTAVGSYMEYRIKSEVTGGSGAAGGGGAGGAAGRGEGGTGAAAGAEAAAVVDNRAWVRRSHTIIQVNSMVYLFGGVVVKDGVATNDLLWMTTERMEWHLQPTKGDKPCPRYGHVMVYDPDHHTLVVFGGRMQDKRRLADVYVLDLDNWVWSKAGCSGVAPAPREDAQAVYYAGHMIVFGGNIKGGRSNELLWLDLATWVWSQPSCSGTAPSPRCSAGLALGQGQFLFVSGGRNNFVLEDLHALDMLNHTWLEITPDGPVVPPPRHQHVISCYQDKLYLFGGLDELGAPSATLYRLSMSRAVLEAGAAAGNAKAEWVELDSELPFNKSRCTLMSGGVLNLLQLGSTTLGRVNEDDAVKGLVVWDVFKTARMETLAVKARPPEEAAKAAATSQGPGGHRSGVGGSSSKAGRVQHCIHSAGKLPGSMTANSAKEGALLTYLGDYTRVFQELYPHRRPLYLMPPNECGVPKFVCSSLRPTLLPYPELYTLEGCCRFVSEFLVFEPLEDPLQPPRHLPSPLSTLQWQSGDVFDFAMVLASLLLGAGFNAFVVLGYAPLEITINDQRNQPCPWMTPQQQQQQQAAAAAAAGTDSSAAAAASSSSNQRPGSQPAQQQQQEGKQRPPTAGTEAAGGGGGATSRDAAPKQQEDAAKKQKYVVRGKPDLESKIAALMQAPGLPTKGSGAGAGAAAAAADSKDVPAAAPGGGSRGGPARPSRRVHAWVLLLPGRREVAAPLFVEPVTGQQYPVASSPYEGVEALWSCTNYWVCMQLPAPHSDVRADPAVISWDLADPTKWEAVLNERQTRPLKAAEKLSAEGMRPRAPGGPGQPSLAVGLTGGPNNASSSNAGAGSAPPTAAAGNRPGTPSSVTAGSSVAAAGAPAGAAAAGGGGAGGATARGGGPGSTVGVPAAPSLISARRGVTGTLNAPGSAVGPSAGKGGNQGGPPSEYAKSEYARSEMGDGVAADKEEVQEQELLPDLPPSWVPKLAVSRDAYDMRCPRGSCTKIFQRSQVELFARFGDCARWDGLVTRITLYGDDARSQVVEVRECYERRKDKLRERVTLPGQDTVVEYFNPGSLFAVKELAITRGVKQSINFYAAARLDGLVCREEVLGVKLTEHFTGREDRLEYRSATFAAASSSSEAGDVAYGSTSTAGAAAAAAATVGWAASAATGGGVMGGERMSVGGGMDGPGSGLPPERLLPIVKIAEKFSRNSAVAAEEDTCKRVFHIAEGRILVRQAVAEGRLTAGYLQFTKDGAAQAVQVDPLAPQPRPLDLLETYKGLQAAEKAVVASVRDSEWETRQISRSRAQQEQGIVLEARYYDIVRLKAQDTDDEPEEVAGEGGDYLSPFLPSGMGAHQLSRSEALLVREKALAALKDRLVERANIIQARLDEEQGTLSRRQAAYARDRDALTAAEEEEYEAAVEEAGFRIAILQRRLARHEETALTKYYELDKRLRHDERLVALLAPIF